MRWVWIVLIVLLSGAKVGQAQVGGTDAGTPDRARLINGVSEVTAPGSPGSLAVFAPEASAVVVGKAGGGSEVAVVASGHLGRGRIVAFAHDGYVGEANFKVADTSKLLWNAFGWKPFEQVFAEYRHLPRAEQPKSDAVKRDQWLVRFSKAAGKNLGPFFEAWGVPTSAGARATVENLPAWMPSGIKPGLKSEESVVEFQVAYESVTGVACSSGRDEAIALDSFLGRCESGWLSVLALRRAARKSAKR